MTTALKKSETNVSYLDELVEGNVDNQSIFAKFAALQRPVKYPEKNQRQIEEVTLINQAENRLIKRSVCTLGTRTDAIETTKTQADANMSAL